MAKYARTDGWYQVKATQQSGKVTADITDLIVVWDLSDFGDDFWDNIEAGGGSLRVLKGDTDTEIAREVLSCDIVAKTGWVHAKADGTNSSTSDTEFWFTYGKSGEVDYAPGGTYGSEAVWKGVEGGAVDFSGVWHDGCITDSTANGFDLTGNGGITANDSAGQVGPGTGFDETDDYTKTTATDLDVLNELSIFTWANRTDTGDHHFIFSKRAASAPGFVLYYLSGSAKLKARVNGVDVTSTDDVSTAAFNHVGMTAEEGGVLQCYVNGATNGASASLVGKSLDSTDNFTIGAAVDGPDYFFKGVLNESRVIKAILSADWIATEYNNQDDPATFWAISDYLPPITGGSYSMSMDLFMNL